MNKKLQSISHMPTHAKKCGPRCRGERGETQEPNKKIGAAENQEKKFAKRTKKRTAKKANLEKEDDDDDWKISNPLDVMEGMCSSKPERARVNEHPQGTWTCMWAIERDRPCLVMQIRMPIRPDE